MLYRSYNKYVIFSKKEWWNLLPQLNKTLKAGTLAR